MPFIGNAPARVPLTSADITDGIISSADIANGAITSAKLASGVGGKVLQVITATDSTTRSTTSSSFATASNTLSVSITPSSASNKIFVICTCGIGMSSTAHTGAITIFRGATDLGSGAGGMSYFKNIADDGFPTSVSVLDSPSTTSSTTYQIYVKNVSGGTTYLNTGKSSITAFEIAA